MSKNEGASLTATNQERIRGIIVVGDPKRGSEALWF